MILIKRLIVTELSKKVTISIVKIHERVGTNTEKSMNEISLDLCSTLVFDNHKVLRFMICSHQCAEPWSLGQPKIIEYKFISPGTYQNIRLSKALLAYLVDSSQIIVKLRNTETINSKLKLTHIQVWTYILKILEWKHQFQTLCSLQLNRNGQTTRLSIEALFIHIRGSNLAIWHNLTTARLKLCHHVITK